MAHRSWIAFLGLTLALLGIGAGTAFAQAFPRLTPDKVVLEPASAEPGGTTALAAEPELLAAGFNVDPNATSSLQRAGEQSLGGIRLKPAAGMAAKASGDPKPVNVVVKDFFPAGVATKPLPLGVVQRSTILDDNNNPVQVEGYLLTAQARGRSLVIPAVIPGGKVPSVDFVLVDHRSSAEWAFTPQLIEDPEDTAPLGDRRPVVMVHGLDTDDINSDYKMNCWDGIRAAPAYKSLAARYKFYIYKYPTYPSAKDNGRALVNTIDATIGLSNIKGRSLIMIAHSLGGVVCRWAMNTNRFGDKVDCLITAASPHHGTGGASMTFANTKLSEKIGWFWMMVVRLAKSRYPDTPGIRSLTWDNFDGAIPTNDQRKYNLLVNTDLANMNRNDPYRDRVVCVMGKISSLMGHGPIFGGIFELARRGQASYRADWGTHDPLVPLSSGAFDGAPVQNRLIYDDLDHAQIIHGSVPSRAILQVIGMHGLDQVADNSER